MTELHGKNGEPSIRERTGQLKVGFMERLRSNWLFAGSLRSGKRAAAIMSLIQSARMNGHDPYAYLKDVLTRLPTQKASALAELLPHNWVSVGKV